MINVPDRFQAMSTFFLAGLIALLPVVPRADIPQPDVVNACNSPQPLNPLMPVGGTNVGSRQGIVWNGKEFVLACANGVNQLVFQRIFADGTLDGPPVVNPGGSNSYAYFSFPVSLAFDGTSYAAVYIGNDGSSVNWQVHFLKLDLNFNPMVSDERVSFYGGSQTVDSYWPELAVGGGQFGIVWFDARSGSFQVYLTVLNSNGTVASGGSAHDLAVSATVFAQQYPTIAWSPVGANGTGGFQIDWIDFRNGKLEIWGEEWALCCGGFNYLNNSVSPGSGGAYHPHLAYGPNWGMLVWDDTRNGNDEIYFALVNQQGFKSTSDIRLTNDVNAQTNPFVVWNGTQFGVFWADARYSGGDLSFQGVSANAVPIGSSSQVTFGLGAFNELSTAAFAKTGFLATGYVYGNHNFTVPLGCNYASYPPCPSNMVAYNISGTAATISWQPSIDPYTDLAYYAVYRNNALVGMTANTLFVDTGLNLSTTYNYSVSAVNAADLTSGGCGTGNSIYVKTNATLVLMMNKSDPNALLAWTDTSGQTLPSYNVFRGTSPQVLQEVAASATGTYSDPNVLADGVTYFYTVDEPGW